MSKYIIEVPDDMEYALLTGQTKTGYWSRAIEFSELEKAELMRGKWESEPYKRARICSCCGHDEPYKFADDDAPIYNFCPHCGADMRGEQDG